MDLEKIGKPHVKIFLISIQNSDIWIDVGLDFFGGVLLLELIQSISLFILLGLLIDLKNLTVVKFFIEII